MMFFGVGHVGRQGIAAKVGGAIVNASPTLDLDFTTGTLDPSLTFTRGSTATYFDATGTMQTAAMNALFPSVMGGANWQVQGGSTQALGGSTTVPDGTTSTTALISASDTTTTTRGYGIVVAGGVASSTAYTASMFFRASPKNAYIQINCTGGATVVGAAYFDLTNGTAVVGADIIAGLTNKAATISNAGNGWYRCSFTFTTTSGNTGVGMYVGPCTTVSSSGDNRAYVGVVGQGIYAWGAQMQLGSAATPYIPTTTAANGAPRFDYDPVTHAALGLLIEEARTNSLLNSRDLSSTWPSAGYTTVVNAAVAPDGTITAKQFTEDSSNGLHYSGPGATLAATTSYTFSIYIKAAGSRYVQLDLDNGGSDGACVTFDLQTGVISGPLTGRGSAVIGTAAMQTVGNGFYRCFMTTTAGAGGAGRVLVLGSNVPSPGFAPGYVGNTANSMFLWGAQLEQAAFPTSYIPTTGAAVTRAIEAARVAIASVGFDTTKGTLSYDYILEGATIGYGSPVGFVGSNEENDNILPDRRNAGGSPTAPTIQTAIINAAGATVGYAAAGSPPVVTAGVVHKGTIAWQINVPVHATHDGVLWTPTQTPASLPVITSLLIGGSPPSQPITNQWARRVRYWPRVLSDAELQSVTT